MFEMQFFPTVIFYEKLEHRDDYHRSEGFNKVTRDEKVYTELKMTA